MRQRWIGAVLLLSTAVLAGCGGGGQRQIGIVVPESGDAAVYGSEVRKGIEIAVAEIASDPDRAALDIRWEDSASDPARAAELLDEIFDQGAVAAIGGITSGEALAMAPVAERRNRLLLSPTASSTRLSESGLYFWRIYPTDFDEASRMARFAFEDLNLERVVILAPESPLGSDAQDVFASTFELAGGELTGTVSYASATPDYDDLAAQALATEPEGIYLADYVEGVAYLIAALRTRGFEGAILTTSAYSPELSEVASGANGVYLTRTAYETDSQAPQMRSFVEAYQERYGEVPSYFAAHGYDAFLLLHAALERGKSEPPVNLWRKLRGIRDFAGVTGTLQFSEQGDVQKYPQVYLMADGELISHAAYQQRLRERREEILRRLEENRRRIADEARRSGG